jgi:hypothetical protein
MAGSAGCAVTPTFTTGYTVEAATTRPTPIAATLVVRQLEDARPPRLYTTQGRAFLTYVPLIPYVSLPFERMDENVRLLSDQVQTSGVRSIAGAEQNVAPQFSQYAYPGSIARAIATDLAAQGLFQEVRYVGNESTAGYQYVLSGTLRETPLAQYATSFCLGAPGVLLWLLPIPMTKTAGSITVDLTLTDTATQAVIWRQTLRNEVSRIDMMYTSEGVVYGGGIFSYSMILPPSDAQVDRQSLFAWHFEALRRAMNDAKPSLAQALQAR